jgi:1-acyl-sn-glycerol-3-phosphate acyltransferase
VKASLFYRASRAVFRVIALPAFRFRVGGAERVPATGPAIVAALHRSWLDPACVGGACRRPVHFLMQRDVYHKPWGRWFFRRMGAIPVPVGGAPSVSALKAAFKLLHEGHVLGIFPEGGIGGKGARTTLYRGVAYLAVRCGAPVIPVAIHGSARAWPHGRRWPAPARVRVEFDAPLDPPRGLEEREAVDAVMRRTRLALDAAEEERP